ncbi:MAG TPA: hypothetical protein VME66_13230 [Candidatus Acidoferrales bacterium]|nr:hypothetical protein [Candidatus Acidoferrales bacterium]
MISKKSGALRHLFLRDLPADLVRRAKGEAALRGVSLARFVRGAIEAALKEKPLAGTAVDVPAEIAQAQQWYAAHGEEFAHLAGEYLAITAAGLLDHDVDLQRLTERVWDKIGYRSIFTPRVGEPALARLHSPKHVR